MKYVSGQQMGVNNPATLRDSYTIYLLYINYRAVFWAYSFLLCAFLDQIEGGLKVLLAVELPSGCSIRTKPNIIEWHRTVYMV